MANTGSAKVICTAQVLDAIGKPPRYVVKLAQYGGAVGADAMFRNGFEASP